ncbi:hypothetical protein [Candidatus Weimeria sp. HCP3S3_B5]|uniref:hypothetical protein n=1 Tax=Candidatus Weimeria sp. HCP3S3_B5 TaxID=3438871 RepID=UPI003F8B7DA6
MDTKESEIKKEKERNNESGTGRLNGLVILICIDLIGLMASLYSIKAAPDANLFLIPASITLVMCAITAMVYVQIKNQDERERQRITSDVAEALSAMIQINQNSEQKLDQKIKELSNEYQVPAEEIINALKAMTKISLGRSKENAAALINSNEALVTQTMDLQDRIDALEKKINSLYEADIPKQLDDHGHKISTGIGDLSHDIERLDTDVRRVEKVARDMELYSSLVEAERSKLKETGMLNHTELNENTTNRSAGDTTGNVEKTDNITSQPDISEMSDDVTSWQDTGDLSADIVQPTDETDLTEDIIQPADEADLSDDIGLQPEEADLSKDDGPLTDDADLSEDVIQPTEKSDQNEEITLPMEEADLSGDTAMEEEGPDITDEITIPPEETDLTDDISPQTEIPDQTDDIMQEEDDNGLSDDIRVPDEKELDLTDDIAGPVDDQITDPADDIKETVDENQEATEDSGEPVFDETDLTGDIYSDDKDGTEQADLAAGTGRADGSQMSVSDQPDASVEDKDNTAKQTGQETSVGQDKAVEPGKDLTEDISSQEEKTEEIDDDSDYDPNKRLSPEEIAALFAQSTKSEDISEKTEEEEKAPDTGKESEEDKKEADAEPDKTLESQGDPNRMMTPEEIQALFSKIS